MMRNINQYLFNSPEEIGFDNYLVLVISFLISIIGYLGTLINIFLQLGFKTIILTLIPAVVITCFYFYSKYKKKYVLSKYILILLSFIIINVQWNVNYGSYGPILYLFVVLQSFIILLFRGWEKVFFTLITFLNVTILFIIEYLYPDVFGTYSGNSSRLIDLYWGMMIYLSLCIILISNAVGFYVKQKEKAQNADKLKSSFLANMSHEIRTPMNAIIGFNQLLHETKITEEQKEYIKIVNDNSYHLLRLIDDIIDISMIEANQVKIINKEFSLNDLFDDVTRIIQQFLNKHDKQNIQLICNKPTDNLRIKGDYLRIKQVLTNLLSNAVKFTEQGSIVFGCVLNNDSITFYVSDTGIGIKKELLPDLFQRFGRIDNTTNEKIFRGVGIGLSISKQLVELMKGKIWVDSEPNAGTHFKFTIPCNLINKIDSSSLTVKDKHDIKFTGALVLIAEDDDISYTFLSKTLARFGIETIRALNGVEAVDLCKTVAGIKLVLMDIKMPQMDGCEATRIIKQMHPQLPVIAQTAFAMKSNEKECYRAGCDDLITKPININLLVQKLKPYLS